MSTPKIGQTYYIVETIYNDRLDEPATRNVTVTGCHYGIRVDTPDFKYGQVFTSEQALRDGSWLLRKDMPWVTMRIVQGRYIGGPYRLFERV